MCIILLIKMVEMIAGSEFKRLTNNMKFYQLLYKHDESNHNDFVSKNESYSILNPIYFMQRH